MTSPTTITAPMMPAIRGQLNGGTGLGVGVGAGAPHEASKTIANSKEDKIIHAIEVGAQINAFPKKIPIMASSDNKTIFFSLFVSYRFGMILDPLNPESNKFTNIFRRKNKN